MNGLLVIFDFDGTITHRDTTRLMFWPAASRRPLRGGLYTLALAFSRLFLSRAHFQRHKDLLLFGLLQRMTGEQVAAVVESYRAGVEPLLRASMVDRIKKLEVAGVKVLVVTASPQFGVESVLGHLRVSVIGATVTPVRGGGRDAGQEVVSCFGSQKVLRFREWAKREGWEGEVAAAWSDSLTDLPLMRLAKRRYWVGPAERAGAFAALDPEGIFVETDD